MPKMAAAAADLLGSLIDHPDADGSQAERRVFSAQFIEGATARLTPAGAAVASVAAGMRAPVAIM